MIVDIGQECLTWSTLEEVEVAFEIRRKLDSLVVREVAVQYLQHGLEGIVLVEVVQRPIFEQTPDHPLEAPNDVEDPLTCLLCQRHLPVVELHSLAPFTIVRRLTAEQWYIAVTDISVGGVLGRQCRRCPRSSWFRSRKPSPSVDLSFKTSIRAQNTM